MPPLHHRRPLPLPTFLYGACYYPEHWDAPTREHDAARMAAAGFNAVRMGEFAWHLFEPTPGTYSFDWMDDAIARLGAAGISTILCTPTATPPRWLTRAHPDILRVDDSGRPLCHGSRQHASHFSPLFREHSRRITRALAEHYADNPHVIGWQTDNELHCHFSEDHSPDAQNAFREFLHAKFNGDISALNRAWGADFWAMAYAGFDDIETPRRDRPTHLNPAHVLDYHRFLSWGVTRFQREQIDILRSLQPRAWITHNGCFASIDYRGDFSRDLDFLGYDSYPFFCWDPTHRAPSQAFNLDHVRAFSGNFFVPEQQSGPGGQTHYLHDTPEPGEMRRMALTSIAHGADSLLFFRWRSCRFGAEEYWCGILDHDNIPRRRYEEAARLGQELKLLGPRLLGSSVRIDLAIAGADFDATYGHQALHHGLPGPRQVAESLHAFFFRRHHAVGIVHPSDDLDGISVYFLPHMPLFRADWLPNLQRWVESGGILVVGPRAGCKDENNNVIAETLPGPLRALTGTTVIEYGKQNASDSRPLCIDIDGQELCSSLWYEVLEPDPGTSVVGTWTRRHLSGLPAITRRPLGKGAVFHVGTWLDDALLSALCRELPLPRPYPSVEGVECIERIHPNGDILRFVINHRDESVILPLSAPATDLLRQRPPSQILHLEANDVALLV
jgi:beta-galactosidase